MNTLSINLNINEQVSTNILTKLNNTNTTLEDYISNLILKDLNSKVSLHKNFYFDRNKEKIYFDNVEISLTKIEYDLFKLLFDNCNSLVTLEKISTEVWNRENVTRFSLRNYVKQLRNKLYPGLIRSHHNCGYMMVIN